MVASDIAAKIEKTIKEITVKLGSGSAVSADLRTRANAAISDASQALKDWREGGMMEDVEALGELDKAVGELAGILKAL